MGVSDLPTRSSVQEPRASDPRAVPRSLASTPVVYPVNNHVAMPHPSQARYAADGAILRDFGVKHGGAGWQFSPVTVGGLCYTAHRVWVETGRSEAARAVRQQADALLRRGERAGNGMVWKYNFSNLPFGARPGWISGMGQGFAMACFAAANTVTRDDRYLSAARQAFVAMRAPFGDRGTTVRVGRGVFFEEVAGAGARPAHILNGMIFALAGVWMVNAIDPRPEYERALRDGILGVRAIVDRYSAPGASLYDLGTQQLAPTKYNLVHVELLQWMYAVTGDPHFLDVALRFISFERRLQPSFSTSTRSPVGMKGSFRGPRDRVVTLHASFARTTPVDRVDLVALSESTVPAEVVVDTGGRSVRVRPRDRFISIDIPRRSVRTVRIRLTPRRGTRVGMRLVTFSDPALRSLAILSSDTSAYRDITRGSRTPLNLTDGRPSTRWSTSQSDPWILVALGEGGADRLRITTCPDVGSLTWSVGADLRSFRHGGSAGATTVVLNLPPDTRYVLIEWAGADGGCLAEVSKA
jgi:hypothetical protein